MDGTLKASRVPDQKGGPGHHSTMSSISLYDDIQRKEANQKN